MSSLSKVDELKIHVFTELKTCHGSTVWKVIKSEKDQKDARRLMRTASEWADSAVSMVRLHLERTGKQSLSDNEIADKIMALLKSRPNEPRDHQMICKC